jgi:hypothetical protein
MQIRKPVPGYGSELFAYLCKARQAAASRGWRRLYRQFYLCLQSAASRPRTAATSFMPSVDPGISTSVAYSLWIAPNTAFL